MPKDTKAKSPTSSNQGRAEKLSGTGKSYKPITKSDQSRTVTVTSKTPPPPKDKK